MIREFGALYAMRGDSGMAICRLRRKHEIRSTKSEAAKRGNLKLEIRNKHE
jgi:hypothetical protein